MTAFPDWFLPVAIAAGGLVVLLLIVSGLLYWRSMRLQNRVQMLDTEFSALQSMTTTTGGMMHKTAMIGTRASYQPMKSHQLEDGMRSSHISSRRQSSKRPPHDRRQISTAVECAHLSVHASILQSLSFRIFAHVMFQNKSLEIAWSCPVN